jgi:hypothetical protein
MPMSGRIMPQTERRTLVTGPAFTSTTVSAEAASADFHKPSNSQNSVPLLITHVK